MAFSPISSSTGDNLVLLPSRCCLGPVMGQIHSMYDNLRRLPVPDHLTGLVDSFAQSQSQGDE
jgi:hypothetical protein